MSAQVKLVGNIKSFEGTVYLRRRIRHKADISANRVAKMYTFKPWKMNVSQKDLRKLFKKHFGDKYTQAELDSVKKDERESEILRLPQWRYMIVSDAMEFITVVGPKIGPNGDDEILAFWIPVSFNVNLMRHKIAEWEHGFIKPSEEVKRHQQNTVGFQQMKPFKHEIISCAT